MVRTFLSGEEAKRIAAIDVGSNSIHMLVVEVQGDGRLRTLETLKEQVRLGAELDEKSMLNFSALSKVSNALKVMRTVAESFRADIRAIGTHALREAKNGEDFCRKVYERSGINVEIVAGREEARLVYLGVQYAMPVVNRSTLLVDVGGGSTEILLGQWGEEKFATSLKLGCVRLAQRYLTKDPLDERELAGLCSYVDSRLDPVVREVRKFGFDFSVATSGTVKALKLVAIGIRGESVTKDLHGAKLTAEEIQLVKNLLVEKKSVRERKLIKNLDSKRADIILPGVVVFDAITRLAGVSEWTISLSGIREGVVIDTLKRSTLWIEGNPQDERWKSVKHFALKLQVDEPRAWHILSLSLSLFEQLLETRRLDADVRWREYLRAASFLHEVGLFLGYTGHHKHAYYLIKSASLLGFTNRELTIIASIVRFHRKRGPRENDECLANISFEERKLVEKMAAILRLCVSLDRGRLGKVQELKVSQTGDQLKLILELHGEKNAFLELYETALEKSHFEKAFSVGLTLELQNGQV